MISLPSSLDSDSDSETSSSYSSDSDSDSQYELLSDSDDEFFEYNVYYSNPYGITTDQIDEFSMDEIDCIEEYVWTSTSYSPKYVIGISNLFQDYNAKYHLLGYYVSAYTFYHYDYTVLFHYLILSTIFFIEEPYRKLEIIQKVVERYENGDTFEYCVLKTFWIRIIQRRWKKVFQERKRVIAERMQWKSIQHFEYYGRYPYGQNGMPSLQGMLSEYSRLFVQCKQIQEFIDSGQHIIADT